MDFNARGGGAAETSFQLAPMIDIVFLLLIWLVVSYAMIEQERALDIRLPKAQAAAERARVMNDIVLDIDREGNVTHMRRPLTPTALESRLRLLAEYARAPGVEREPGAILRADEETPHKHVVAVMDICGRAGVRRVFFATVPPKGEGGAEKR